ncbi:hypothetical protein CEXT_89661 [Caerostris extrusa]|uniref:Uncharacterized protein n=1 Tax=Caerostris extrusa TaxID=172846 RepID=A0AAV4UDW0_CAEEX|nr:hypothetical protein CEXT_89661 [Caerostris extrusa]
MGAPNLVPVTTNEPSFPKLAMPGVQKRLPVLEQCCNSDSTTITFFAESRHASSTALLFLQNFPVIFPGEGAS